MFVKYYYIINTPKTKEIIALTNRSRYILFQIRWNTSRMLINNSGIIMFGEDA